MIKVRRNATRQIAALRAEYTIAIRRDRRSSAVVIKDIDPDVAWSYLSNAGARVEIHGDAVRLYPNSWNAALWYEFTKPGTVAPVVTKSHAHCDHESTKTARAKCRRQNAA
jgi:hypothetical protein